MARHRRRGPGARPGGDRGRAPAAGQAQADLHAAYRHRRSRRDRQRGQASSSPAARKNRSSTGITAATKAACARSARRTCAQKQPTRIVEEAVRGMLPKTKMGDAMWRQAEGLRGRQASARRPEAGGEDAQYQERGRITWQQQSSITAPDAARHRRPACSSGPAPGTSTINHKPIEAGLPHRGAPHPDQAAAGGHRNRREVRRAGDDRRRRHRRPGRRAPPRHRPRAGGVQRRAALAAEEGGLPDARRAHQGTQEVRQTGARKRFQFSKR